MKIKAGKLIIGRFIQYLFPLCLSAVLFAGVAAPVFPDRISILEMLENRQFDELDEMLQTMQSNYEQGTGDERLLDYVLETMANSSPEYEVLMDDWVSSHPESYVSYLARAYYYYGVAWSWRGYRSDNDAVPARRKNMQTYLRLTTGDITQAIRLKPRLSAADALAIKVLMMLGNHGYKKQVLKDALEIDPASYLVRASYLFSLKPGWGGRVDELMQFTKETEAIALTHPQLKLLAGYADYIFADALARQGRFEEAVVHFDFAIDRGADHIVYMQRGINYYHLQEYAKALHDFNHSLTLWPQNPQVLKWRSFTLQSIKQGAAALTDLDMAVRLAPMEKQILMAHALLLRKMRRYGQVLDDYRKALFYHQEDAEIWFESGMHYSHELMNFEAASRDLQRATELEADMPAYWYEYAAALHYNNDCKIVVPLMRYLQLCDAGQSCHPAEVDWARHAQIWLQENKRCSREDTESSQK